MSIKKLNKLVFKVEDYAERINKEIVRSEKQISKLYEHTDNVFKTTDKLSAKVRQTIANINAFINNIRIWTTDKGVRVLHLLVKFADHVDRRNAKEAIDIRYSIEQAQKLERNIRKLLDD